MNKTTMLAIVALAEQLVKSRDLCVCDDGTCAACRIEKLLNEMKEKSTCISGNS